MKSTYQLIVQDKLEPDEDKNCSLAQEFETEEAAIKAAKAVIDDYIEGDYALNPNDRPLTLLDSFLDFGLIPFIIGPKDTYTHFNARRYAEARCYEVCGAAMPAESFYGGMMVLTGCATGEDGK
jgi:hypothetical protein